MDIRSLSRRTDLIFSRYSGEVLDRGDYTVIRTPTNPSYHWGNFIVFAAPPKLGDHKIWTDIFAREFGSIYETIRHMVFTWDTVPPQLGDCSEFIAHGFEQDEGVVLSTSVVNSPPRYNSDIEVKKLKTDQQWQDAFANQIACADSTYPERSYRLFKERQMAEYRSMTADGLGHWLGAYLNGELVADLGVFYEGELARYQSVGTHPRFRRQGICQTLVYEAAKIALAEFGVTTLVMEADAHYHAARIYESVGFKPTERNYALGWWLP